MKFLKWLLFLGILSLSWQNPAEENGQNSEDLPPEFQEVLDKKIRDYKKSQLSQCLQFYRLKAWNDVDSVILSFDKLFDIDSFDIGEKPVRPAKPDFLKSESDSLKDKKDTIK